MTTTDYYPCVSGEEVCRIIDKVGKDSLIDIVPFQGFILVFYQTENK